ncbi:phosphoenolpyruvate-protein phosphotransferase PtsI [Blochmannia endosymbiont of Camponotus (Colobopsis) obliquus]|uniref:phosphoenolpyruvate-protein phosphotransferase PtsI n=1 Tax=Blochmannia endosymbiont of Camponotus (Colobopsis) obliquus TaxID=1505597 RepID=UPI00061A6937|nr:phosphoenolpyruvate-protein phosphotransferase PtsI [Blochmannia endosymbiont of Camponotus (Colobopsis) obliquus]AKC60657.1 phosphoenolpyruvate-protein phosphotransferase [Blochmannia endosymbiont of Camponotus (Colobopsis) obliquus]
MISGISVSPGIAFGKALVIKKEKIFINQKKIAINDIDNEIHRFLNGRTKTSQQLKKIKNKAGKTFGKKKEAIFEGHIMLLEDKELEQDIITLIKEDLITAEAAINSVIETQARALEQLNDEYLKERATDVRDIGNRLLRNVLNIPIVNLNNLNKKIILVTTDLKPSETVQLDLNNILGFITDDGGITSHTSIMARSLELPAIVGTGNITKKVCNNDFLILNAIHNEIYINPKTTIIKKLKILKKQYSFEQKELIKLKNLPAITLDGYQVEISANIGTINDITHAKNNGAKGIGLYRTEFLFMNRSSLPSEEEQFQNYKTIAESIFIDGVTIRILDIGGDKNLPYMKLPKEDNPFLGWRAIRIILDRKEILHTQLRAILRASAFGKLQIMYPMIISIEEVRALKTELDLIKIQLRKEKKNFDENIETGVMIETPAAATIAHYLAKEVDFFSIGTNDLIQYTLAIDRGNKLISHLYQPLSPAILLLIKQVIDAAHQEGKWTSMCGEMAGDERNTSLLLGMGLDKFSMNATSILKIKKIIRTTKLSDAKSLAKEALCVPTTKDLNNLINNFLDHDLKL